MNDMAMPKTAPLISALNLDQLPKLPEIPRARYLDAEFYRAELEHVWKKSWLNVGHVSEFEKDGSYLLIDLPFAPIFVVRGKDGNLRAFLNSCQHRGATVLKDQAGCVKTLSCQYHGWTYDLTGKLIGVPDQESFPGLALEKHMLVNLRCELWGGLVFVNLDPNAPPLLEWLGVIANRYSEIAEAPLRVVSKQYWDINCNWKIVLDAFRETYHVDIIHRQSAAQLVDGNKVTMEMNHNGHNSLLSGYRPDFLQAKWEGVMARTTLAPMPGTERKEFVENVVTFSIFPNVMVTMQAPGFPLLQWWPLSRDHTKISFVWYGMDWGTGEKPDEWDAVTSAFEVVIPEDLSNLVSIQKSLEADPVKGIPLSKKEALLYQMHAEVDRLIGAENIPENLRVPNILEKYFAK